MARAPSKAVLAARARRSANAISADIRMEKFVQEATDKVGLTVKQRIGIATKFLRTRVVKNISRPVTKLKSTKGRTRVTERSKPGDFPKADTTQLMKSIFDEVRSTGDNSWEGYVGTPLLYGLILETRRDRSFLVRTMNEELPRLRALILGPSV